MVLALLSSCTYDSYEELRPDASKKICSTSQDSVSFNKDIIPFFNKNCSTVGCHSGLKPEGDFNLEAAVAYKTLSKKGSGYIEVADPKSSVLYSALVSVSDPMPPTGKLDDCSIKMVYKWMEQGGKNN